MRAAYASATKPDEPLAALTVGDQPEPSPPDGWVTVDIRASSLNHHEIWSLRGVGLPADRLPMILGCDASGVDAQGNEVVIYPVIEDPQDPRGFSLLSERWPGTLAERVAVPAKNLVPKPAGISFLDAACLPTAWLTAYHMLTARGRVSDAEAVLVQGAGGGVATAAAVLAVALGKRVYATSRDAGKRDRIAELGATAVEPGARLPERVGVVIESVGAPTFEHSLKCAAPGARVVVCGATGGPFPKVDLRRVFMMQLEILGSTMGTADELAALLDLCVAKDIRPIIDSTYGFSAISDAFARLNSGEVFGKVAIDHLH
ncbi:Zn-dependent oxidoreductase [Actinoplanes sp. NBRC 14428]|uniref:NADPH:quinone reductase-like Zn-dependent oxidoreductase n=1 Tax=Pseudosporangium ferrugineum TaxID=439699 RepID=A0A2T0SDJ5_9ACTN|nr:zinc-binding dehydrogenase [Pseudosporangium ferrugineum]PRY31487.1 NADPH:quinone reductase-like Zn-dependent oxidoreductase [Pseudosporangium ferrugineum]BCJ54369.1 Zn-dependent oxidoreductase [Actinoplanes sp. NBRC 14428]